ncbi:MAG: HD domain-containing protein [Bacteroidetes bacterium]|nr:HD domain-containing protein [Bacteroidota bacterium]
MTTAGYSKIFNDPVYGFITVSDPLHQQIINHPWFQRLRRITQGGLSHLVYPGAHHTRFHHALGAMHLMEQALLVIQRKGTAISPDEMQAGMAAVLLHDVGHGPFSHTLEGVLIPGVHHETLTVEIMQKLNAEFNGALTLAIQMFLGTHPRPFFNQLIASQLDVDRLDYLRRDSFYTGVAEGVIGSERIIKMMVVAQDELLVEEKGIYSVEKFLIARRLMYWQVYLHKTVLGAEALMHQIFRRARQLAANQVDLFGTPALIRVLNFNEHSGLEVDLIQAFAHLDDYDAMAAIKVWSSHPDRVLSQLCSRLLNRQLLKVRIQSEPLSQSLVETAIATVSAHFSCSLDEAGFFVSQGSVSNQTYDAEKGPIRFFMKSGEIRDFFSASDNLSVENALNKVRKHFVCYPKEVQIA